MWVDLNLRNEVEIHHKLRKKDSIVFRFPRLFNPIKKAKDEGIFYYIRMELCDMDLAEYLKERGGFLAEDEARVVMKNILASVKIMKEQSVLHRDLKLENILVQKSGQMNTNYYKICDFGCAEVLKDGEFSCSDSGTPRYFPPEMLNKEPKVSHGMDVWALGIIYYQLLFGFHPFGRPFPD